jgi:UDP-N-acetylmuramoyl-L-alanyl-D-glutamate--2,6-diaminopimelate ligase
MRRYREAKAKLFAWETLRHAVINLDDAFGVELVRRCRRPGLKVIGYGFGEMRGAARGPRVARVTGSGLVTGARGVAFDVTTPWGAARVTSTALGRHNAANLLGTLAVLLASGVALKKAVAALSALAPVPGRLQRFGGGRKPLVVVDYAHTPDALKQALTTLREVADHRSPVTGHRSRLFCVFGCGGDRDRGKRPLMGRVAAKLADRAIVTSDNPRSEDPHEIIADILAGVRRGEVGVDADRRDAILRAVAEARGGDIVLVAGKGHEAYQEIRGVRQAFSDAQVAEEALAQR